MYNSLSGGGKRRNWYVGCVWGMLISDGDDDGDDGWVPWVVEVVVGKRSFRCEDRFYCVFVGLDLAENGWRV